MEEEVLFWSRLNGAMASFCHQAVLEDDGLQSLVSSLVGDDLEWCGPLALSYTNRKYVETQAQCQELNMRCKFLENSLSNELLIVAGLRNKLKQSQTEASDNEWRLQEQIAQLNTALIKEKSQNQLLEMRAAINTTKRYTNSTSKVNAHTPSVNVREDTTELRTGENALLYSSNQQLNTSSHNNNSFRNKALPDDSVLNNSINKSNVQLEGKENSITSMFTRKNSGLGLKEQQRSFSSSQSIIADL